MHLNEPPTTRSAHLALPAGEQEHLWSCSKRPPQGAALLT